MDEEEWTDNSEVEDNVDDDSIMLGGDLPLEGDDLVEGEEEEEEEDEDDLQKFKKSVTASYLTSVHPECLHRCYDEVIKLSAIVRNEHGRICDPFHKTVPILTKYERAKVLGLRTKQLESGMNPFIEVPNSVIEPYLIAEYELEHGKIPFIIKRPLPNNTFEYWKVCDLELI